ncbi:MAG: hypothetical protein LCH41_06475 [Armatimonadetes bacterium]|nr:hypothetical protein [Armatimonadota bacterium]
MSTGKTILTILGAIVAVWLGFQLLGFVFAGLVGLLGLVIKLAIPVALVLGVLYVAYRVTGGDKALPGERKRLP